MKQNYNDAGFVLFNIDDNGHCLSEDFIMSQVMTSFDKKDKADNWRNHPTFRRNHPTERLFYPTICLKPPDHLSEALQE